MASVFLIYINLTDTLYEIKNLPIYSINLNIRISEYFVFNIDRSMRAIYVPQDSGIK